MISRKLRQDVREQNVRHIINDLLGIILNDRGLETPDFEESLAYVKNAGIKIEEPFDGKPFRDEKQWNSEYWSEQMSALRFNFCRERIEHVKTIGRKLYPSKKRTTSHSSYQARNTYTHTSHHTQKEQQNSNFLQVPAEIMALGIAALLALGGAIVWVIRHK